MRVPMILETDIAGQSSSPWFVVWTHARAEKKVEQRIAALGLPTWLPVVREQAPLTGRPRFVDLRGCLSGGITDAEVPIY
jgi:hypothetical protein